MDKISLVKFTDAYYYSDDHCHLGGIPLHKAYGFVEFKNSAIIVRYIKGVSSVVSGDINHIERGLVIPEKGLFSEREKFDDSLFKGIKLNTKISVKWSNVVYSSNVQIPDIAIMKTEGVLERNDGNHIVLRKPTTIRLHPLPERKHPNDDPTYYVIPKSVVLEVQEIK